MTEDFLNEFVNYEEEDLMKILEQEGFQQNFLLNDDLMLDENVNQINYTERTDDVTSNIIGKATLQSITHGVKNYFSSELTSHNLMTVPPKLDCAPHDKHDFEDLSFSETFFTDENHEKLFYTNLFEPETPPSIKPQIENVDTLPMTSCNLSQVIKQKSGKSMDEILQMATKPFNQLLKKLTAVQREELKRKRRQLKNRSYARTCRNKKGDHYHELKMEVENLRTKEKHMAREMEGLRRQNQLLKQQIASQQNACFP